MLKSNFRAGQNILNFLMTLKIFTAIIDQAINDSVYGAHIKGCGMQIHPLFSVKKAAEALGVEKQFLRNQLEQGMIRGEKRRVGERDKWFIYNGEVKDLRDTKRLHELLERAGRISTEDMGDFFDEDDEPVSARDINSVGSVDLVGSVDSVETLEAAPTLETPEAVKAAEAITNSLDSLDFLNSGGTVGSAASFGSSGSVVPTTYVEPIAKAKSTKPKTANLYAAKSNAAKPVLTAESFTEFLNELLDDHQINEDHNAAGLIENQLTTANESLSSASAGSSASFTEEQLSANPHVGVVFESQVMDDLSVDDLFFEKVEIVEPDDIDFPEDELVNTDDTVSGSSKITVESMLQKLTAEFAAQLAEERNRVTDLTHQLELKEESLRLLPDLERRLEQEQSIRQAHQDEVAILKSQIASLETERVNANKPWWKKLFG
jgi:hypothetical protein